MSEEEDGVIKTVRMLDDEIEKEGWDQPAILFAVKGHQMDENVGLMEVYPCPGWYQCVEVTNSVQDTLRVMNSVMHQAPDKIRKDAFPAHVFYGLALATESWTLNMDPKKMSLQELAAAKEASENHTIHERADRTETRIICAVTIGGRMVMLNHVRDGETDIIDSKNLGEKSYTGEIPRLLNELIKEITA